MKYTTKIYMKYTIKIYFKYQIPLMTRVGDNVIHYINSLNPSDHIKVRQVN
jgi:hypothetical protein